MYNDMKMQDKFNKKGELVSQYLEYERIKNPIINRCETYARWTLPTVLPRSTSNPQDEKQHDFQSVGARAANHLANKLAFTLFAPARPFFRLEPSPDYLATLEEKGLNKVAVAQVLAKAEQLGMRRFTTWRSRTAAIFALKSLIITGNSLMYFPKDGKAQVYNFRDYTVKRDLSGEILDIITQDKKKISTLPEDIRQQVLAERNNLGQYNKQRRDEEDCTLYTRVKYNPEDDKFHVFQAVDEVPVQTVYGTYKRNELPWIALTWDLQRGSDYGIGLVEDYAGDFHALSTLSQSMIVGAAIAADIKFLVDPTGATDYKELNNSPSGSYVAGREQDISALTTDKQNDFQFVSTLINQYEKRIGLGFLLGSAVTRDAERVTAEEIRFQAQELETGLGGQYSRLAEEFQLPMTYILLKDIDFSIEGQTDKIEPIIITGLESLSRNSEVDKLRLFMQDMAGVNALPPEMLRWMKMDQIAAIFGTARSVDYQDFMKSAEEVQAEVQQEQQQALQVANAAGQQDAVNKGKQAQLSNQ